jgi:hypothetical protein
VDRTRLRAMAMLICVWLAGIQARARTMARDSLPQAELESTVEREPVDEGLDVRFTCVTRP